MIILVFYARSVLILFPVATHCSTRGWLDLKVCQRTKGRDRGQQRARVVHNHRSRAHNRPVIDPHMRSQKIALGLSHKFQPPMKRLFGPFAVIFGPRRVKFFSACLRGGLRLC
jgi:hypothetical protein